MTATKLCEQRIVGVDVVVGGDNRDMPALGPGLEVVDCRVVVKYPEVIVVDTRVVGANFEVQGGLSNEKFFKAHFDGERFSGMFSGCDLGSRPGEAARGGLCQCDFPRAELNGRRFMNVDVDGCILAGWPTVLILEPRKHAEALAGISCSGRWGIVFGAIMKRSPEWCSTVAVDVDCLRLEFG